MNTFIAKKETVKKSWRVIDADGAVLGRLATRLSTMLRGRDKAIYTPNVDTGDFVIVINAAKVKLTGNKVKQKTYYHHSLYPGGLKSRTAEELLRKSPEELIFHAVKGMLPKNRLADRLLTKLKVYPGPDHPHAAQVPAQARKEKTEANNG